MSSHHCLEYARRRLPIAVPLVLGLCLILPPDLGAQTFSPLEASVDHSTLNFEVLTSGVGSGSRSQTRSELRTKFDALESIPETRPLSGVGPRVLAAVTSAADLGADLPAAAQVAHAAPVAAEADQVFRPRAADPPPAADRSIEEVIAEWQRHVEDDYQVGAVVNPFLPVEDPRDRVDSITLPTEAAWSPLLRLELGQLKLVAVTAVSSQAGDALASFEDASGISYLLRQGDRIGKNKGRIVKIDPAGVVIEERPQGSAASRMVEMRLTI